MVNFGLLTAEIRWRVWGTPANFNGFRVLAALLHVTLVMVALCNRADHYIFALLFLSYFFLLLSFFLSSPNLSGRGLDVYHTSTHGVALVRI